jgi:hypothetical protein
MKFARFPLLLVFILMTACVHNIGIKGRESSFRDWPDKKIPLSVGLYISENSRTYVVKECERRCGFNILVGEALEKNAFTSLNKIFREVYVIEDKFNISPNIERIITVDINPASTVEFRPLDSNKSISIVLDSTIFDTKWNAIWEISTVENTRENTKSNDALIATVVSPVLGVLVQKDQYGRIGHMALVDALENLNKQLTSGSGAAILQGKP